MFSCLGVCVWFGCRRTNFICSHFHIFQMNFWTQSTCPSAIMSKLELRTIIGIAQYNLLELYSKHKLKGQIRPCLIWLKYLNSSPLSCWRTNWSHLTGLTNLCLSVITCGQNVCGSNYRKYWHLISEPIKIPPESRFWRRLECLWLNKQGNAEDKGWF